MNTELHTVLGASGGAGRSVVEELQSSGRNVRVVERTRRFPDVETRTADLLDKGQAEEAIAGSGYVHLCVGLPYKIRVWRENWPILIQNVIHACQKSGSVLIFLDNIYMYGPPPLSIPFDEQHPQSPVTSKGAVRKEVADIMMEAVSSGKVQGLIARAADFYGPYARNSLLYIALLENMLKGKAPVTFNKLGIPHTFACTTDIGKAMVMLAEDPSTYGEAWHLPVSRPVTMEEAVDVMNQALGTQYKLNYMGTLIRKMLTPFIPGLKDLGEMLYQSNSEYVMSHEKFMGHFPDFEITSFESGIEQMVQSFKEQE